MAQQTMPHSLTPYPSPTQRETELDWLVGRLGGEIHTYGHSVQGRPLRVAHIPAHRPTAHAVLICANIHGVEFVSSRVALSVLRQLPSLSLLEQTAVWVAPCLNPDGYARTWECEGQASLAALRCNANGVDLNRNFPMPWNARPGRLPFTGARHPGKATHRGRAPGSEPEVAALMTLLEQVRPHAGVNLHSFMGTIIQPKLTHWSDHRQYSHLIAALRGGQRGGHRYSRLAFPPLDVFTGEQEDYQHHIMRCWSVCLETFPVSHSLRQSSPSRSIFWRFNPTEPQKWIHQDVAGIAAFLHAALSMPRPPRRPGAAEHRLTW